MLANPVGACSAGTLDGDSEYPFIHPSFHPHAHIICTQGKFAKKHDWVQAFGVQDDAEVCRLILEHGELQVSEGERKAQVEKCVIA